MNIPILKELERLKTKHATSKVTSAAFQPDEKDQKELIIKNGQRKEEEKRLIELKLKEADVKLKEAAKVKNQDNTATPADGEDSLRPDRAQTAPSMTSSGKLARSKSFVFAVNERPQTSAGETTGDKSCAFDAVLKSASGHFSQELKLQVDQQARDSKKIFDSLITHFKAGGVGCQFSVKRDFEVIDINNVVAANHSTNSHATMKFGDINNMKKKDGIALIFDPTIDTGGSVVKIRVYFQKAIDLVTEESCSRDYSFHSNGNYFGLHMTGESACVNPNKTTNDALAGLRSPNSYSPLPDSSPAGPLTPVAPRSPAGSPTMQSGSRKASPTTDYANTNSANKAGFKSISNAHGGSSNSSLGSKQKGCSLPGWQGRPPIFIPSARCSIEIIRSSGTAAGESANGADPHTVAKSTGGGASTAYNLSRLRIFAVAAPSARAAVKKLHEFCEHFFVSHTANLTVAGGISALNLAALHGNLEGVKQLVESGANINARSRESKNHTALHEAVIGGHKEVAQYLLQMGANQLLRDEIGYAPLHHACRLESIALARVLIEAESGKRALLLHNNSDQKPIELCTSNFMKIRIEGAMRKLKIFVKPRVSILER